MSNGPPESAAEYGQVVEQPAAVLVLAAFQGSPWENAIGRATITRPEDVIQVFGGLAGLYWAYAPDLPFARDLEAPTKHFIAELLGNTTRSGMYATDHQREEMLTIAAHLQFFVGMWVGTQGEDVKGRRRLQHIVDALHADAANRLDDIEYNNDQLNPFLQVIAQQCAELSQDQADETMLYRSLTRHFTTSTEAPPVAVRGATLMSGLNFMRNRYIALLRLPSYQPNANAEHLMWQMLGVKENDHVHSVRELLLLTDPETHQEQLALIESGLRTLTDEALAEELAMQSLRSSTKNATTEEPAGEVGADAELWELVGIIQKGGQAAPGAMERLFTLTYPRVAGFLYRRLRNPHAVADCASEVYVKAIKAIPRLRNEGKTVSGWLITIASNVYKDTFRQREVTVDKFNEILEQAGDSTPHTIAGKNDPIEALALNTTLRNVLLTALGQLETEDQKKVVVLRYFEGLEYEEIAAHLGTTHDTAKAMNLRALRSLRRVLTRTDPELAEAFLGLAQQQQLRKKTTKPTASD